MAELSSSIIYGSLLITGPLTSNYTDISGGLRVRQAGGGNAAASLIELGDRNSTWSYGINFNVFNDGTWKYRNSDYGAAISLDVSGNLHLQVATSGAANAAFPWGSVQYIRLNNNGNFGVGVNPSYKLDVNGDVNVATANRYKINGVNLNVVAGNGLTGGGDLTPGVTLTLGTPSTLTGATTNAVTTSSHTHAITLTPADVNAAPSTHALVGTNHTASGLTIGHFLKATSATQFGFGVHGLTAADVGAAAEVHNHGTGTAGKLPKWNDTAGGLGNSIIQDYSTYARVSGAFVVENSLEGIISNESLLNNFISGEGWTGNNLILYSAKNRLALAHKKYTVTTTPAVNIDNVFLPGDTCVNITSDKLPLMIEILGYFSNFSGPAAYRPFVFMHMGFFGSIKFEIRGANGTWYVVDDISNNASVWWVGSTNSVPSIPFSGVRFTFNNASGSPVYLRELGFFHPRSEPWTQYIMAQGDSIYGSLNFSGVDSDIITPAGEHLAIMPGTGGNVGIKTTNPAYDLDVNGDVNVATANRYKINGVNLNVVAGNGLTGGGDLIPGSTVTLGTPTTLTASTSNAVSTSSHTHAITGFATTSHNHGTGTAGYIAKWQTNELLERSVISESANLLNLATSAVLQGFNYYHKNVRTEWIQYDGAYRAYLKFPASTGFAGSLRLTITIPYIAYGTSAPGGTLIYEYGFMGNSSGTAYVNKRECKSTIGNTADYVVAGDIVWHTTDSCWAIPIYNLQKRNYPLVSIDCYSWYDLDSTFTITCSSWETYSMVPSRDYSWINDRLAVGKSGGAAFTLDVNGDVNVATANRYKINGVNLNVVAGNGLTGGGDLIPGSTVTLGTPGTCTSTTTNAVTTSSHTHVIQMPETSINILELQVFS